VTVANSKGVPDENWIGILAGLNDRAALASGIALACRKRHPTKSRTSLQKPSNRTGNTMFGQPPTLGLLYVQVHSRTFFTVKELAKPLAQVLSRWAEDVTASGECQNRYRENSEGMVEFPHSSPTSIPRDPENEHGAHFWG